MKKPLFFIIFFDWLKKQVINVNRIINLRSKIVGDGRLLPCHCLSSMGGAAPRKVPSTSASVAGSPHAVSSLTVWVSGKSSRRNMTSNPTAYRSTGHALVWSNSVQEIMNTVRRPPRRSVKFVRNAPQRENVWYVWLCPPKDWVQLNVAECRSNSQP